MTKFYLLFNPKSGVHRTQKLLNQALNVFREESVEIEVVHTTHHRHAYELANSLNFEGFDGLCALGGDGTMHEMVNGLLNRKDSARVPLGILPAGTGNSYLYDRDILDLEKVARATAQNQPHSIDVLEVVCGNTTHYSFNIVGWGMMTHGNITAEKLRWLGKRRYDAGALWEIAKCESFPARVQTGSETYEYDMHFVLGANTVHTGTGMKMAPKAKMDDSLMDLLLVKAGSRWDLLQLFPLIFSGGHIHSPLVTYLQVPEFELQTNQEMLLNLDGEILGTSPCKVKVIPNSLQVLL